MIRDDSPKNLAHSLTMVSDERQRWRGRTRMIGGHLSTDDVMTRITSRVYDSRRSRFASLLSVVLILGSAISRDSLESESFIKTGTRRARRSLPEGKDEKRRRGRETEEGTDSETESGHHLGGEGIGSKEGGRRRSREDLLHDHLLHKWHENTRIVQQANKKGKKDLLLRS